MITISGEKFAKEFIMSPMAGMWLSVIVLFPLGLFLTYKASRDSALFNMDAILVFFKNLFNRRKNLSTE